MGKTEEAIRDLVYSKKACPCTVIQQELDRAEIGTIKDEAARSRAKEEREGACQQSRRLRKEPAKRKEQEKRKQTKATSYGEKA